MKTTIRKGQFYRNTITRNLILVARYSARKDEVLVAPYMGGLFPVDGATFRARYQRVSQQEAENLAAESMPGDPP